MNDDADFKTVDFEAAQAANDELAVRLADFVAYMQSHDYVFMPAGDFWPAARVNARLPPVKLINKSGLPIIDRKSGEQKEVKASDWLAKNAPVEQMTWAPGLPQLVRHRLVGDGGWIERQERHRLQSVPAAAPTTGRCGEGRAVDRARSENLPRRGRPHHLLFSPIACNVRTRRSTTGWCSAALRASARIRCSNRSSMP